MSPSKNESTLSQLKTPRAAAVAGILFSILLGTIMFLIQDLVTVNPTDISQKWLQKHADNASLALKLVPFAGIAFLWFTGVLRDWLDDREDRFFSTVFLGSGILSVAMLFLCAAIFGAVFGTYTVANDRLADGDVYVFGYTCTKEILGNYTVRIMGVYMCSIAAIWTRTSLMPRWLTIITYLLAFVFIFFAGMVSETRYVFPCWVLLVSAYILNYNFRTRNQENKGQLTPVD